MTNDSLHTYAYDAENRTKTVDSTAATYSYVGALRVKKVVGATTTVYVFSGSKVIAEYANGALSKEYVYAGSKMLTSIAANGTVTYHHPDHLSDRAQTDSAGGLLWWQGHYPFGETWYESAPSGKWKFTSYERDSESGVDYAIFRYDTSRLGRFMSPDPLGGSVYDPQSLNRYSYVRNDPVNGADPLGLTNFKLQVEPTNWNCSLNGTLTPCSFFWSVVGAGGGGSVIVCPPGIDCSSVHLDPKTGQVVFGYFNWVGGSSTQVKMGENGLYTMSVTTGFWQWQTAPLVDFFSQIPWSNPWVVSWVLPLVPEPGAAGVGPAGDFAMNPRTGTVCVGIGVGASIGKTVSGGLLTTGGPGGSFPYNADKILNGWSVSGGVNAPFVFLGPQGMSNASGWAAGPAIGIPGASIASVGNYCARLW